MSNGNDFENQARPDDDLLRAEDQEPQDNDLEDDPEDDPDSNEVDLDHFLRVNDEQTEDTPYQSRNLVLPNADKIVSSEFSWMIQAQWMAWKTRSGKG